MRHIGSTKRNESTTSRSILSCLCVKRYLRISLKILTHYDYDHDFMELCGVAIAEISVSL